MTGTNSIYGPTWYVATMAGAQERPRVAFDLDVDACVVGGGLAGLTAAREIARRGWSVAVLEARRFAWSASGRNAGVVAPGFAERPAAIVERIGFDRAKALWELSQAGVDYVRSAVRDIRMPGVAPVDGWLRVQRIDDEAKSLAHADLLRAFGAEVEAWSVERVRASLKSPRYFHGIHLPGAFHIHPLNYALGLVGECERLGAQLFENSPVLAIDPAGVRKRIDVRGARVRAGHIVLAGSAHIAPLFPPVARSVMPIASYMAVTAPLGERLADAVAFAGGVADTRRSGDYYRIVDGDRLLWGGRITARLSEPRGLARMLRRDIQAVYPQLGKVEMAHAWTGVMGYALHKMPQIGEVLPGVWVASAFGGHGLNTTAMAGELIARAMIEGDDRVRLFAPYDLVGTGGKIGRAVAQGVFWSMRLRDRIDETLARRRERSADTKAAAPEKAGSKPLAGDNSGGADRIGLAPPVVAEAGLAGLAAPAEPVRAEPSEPGHVLPPDQIERNEDTPGRGGAAARPTVGNSRRKARTPDAVYATRDPQRDGQRVKRGRKIRKPAGEEHAAGAAGPGLDGEPGRGKRPREPEVRSD